MGWLFTFYLLWWPVSSEFNAGSVHWTLYCKILFFVTEKCLEKTKPINKLKVVKCTWIMYPGGSCWAGTSLIVSDRNFWRTSNILEVLLESLRQWLRTASFTGSVDDDVRLAKVECLIPSPPRNSFAICQIILVSQSFVNNLDANTFYDPEHYFHWYTITQPIHTYIGQHSIAIDFHYRIARTTSCGFSPGG